MEVGASSLISARVLSTDLGWGVRNPEPVWGGAEGLSRPLKPGTRLRVRSLGMTRPLGHPRAMLGPPACHPGAVLPPAHWLASCNHTEAEGFSNRDGVSLGCGAVFVGGAWS